MPVRRAIRPLLAVLALLGAVLLAGALPASAAAPVVTIEPASSVTFDSAKATGDVNPEGEEVNYHFEYVTDAQFNEEPDPVGAPGVKAEWTSANQTGFGTIPAGTSTLTPVEPATLESLAPGTTYHLRLVAENGAAESAQAVAPTFPTEAVARPSASGFAISAKTSTSIHLEGFVNSGGSEAGEGAGEWEFNLAGGPHKFAAGFEGAVADGNNHNVQVDVTGLEPNTPYTAVLSAHNAQTEAEGLPAEESIAFTTDAVAPEIRLPNYSGYSSSELARLLAEVNPRNSQLQSCVFEYGTTNAYGQSVPCEANPESNEAGNVFYVTGAQVEGLAASTTYHYRLSADNGTGGPIHGPDRTFTTEATPPDECEHTPGAVYAPNLPPCWGYELISPAEAGGQSIASAAGLDDTHAWVGVGTPLTGAATSGNFSALAATRDASGWHLRELADPANPGDTTAVLVARSHDGESAIVEGCPKTAINCIPGRTLAFERVDADGVRTVMLSVPTGSIALPTLVGVSDDAHRIFIANPTASGAPPLLPEDTHTQGAGLYESHDGVLSYLAVDETGAPLPCGGFLANDQATLPAGTGFEQNGLSADGETVFYESPDPQTGCPEPIDIYVRRNGRSTDISAPTNGNPDLGSIYDGNTRDGNTVYFTTESQLLASDTDALADIYAYDVPSGTLTAVTSGADVRYISPVNSLVTVSPNGNYIYFVAERAIDGEGVDGARNLFTYHDGTTSLVATTTTSFFFLGEGLASGIPSLATSDGRHLLFQSAARLTGQPVGGTQQYYQYDATDNSLACVTCSPANRFPGPNSPSVGNVIPGASVDQYLQSDDGRTVVFATKASLLPQDTNGIRDSYLWREGKLYLLDRAQTANVLQTVVSTTPSGHTAYFQTGESLVPGAVAGEEKLYAARLNPMPRAADETPPPCRGEACQGAASEPPSQAGPTSNTVSGPPNPKSVTCHKGKVKKSGHCVKRKSKHLKKHKHHKRHARTSRKAGK